MPDIQSMHKTVSRGDTVSRTADAVALFRTVDFNVYHGAAHVVQNVSLELTQGIMGIVGRNGMGKTSLCDGITGMCSAAGQVQLKGRDISGLPPYGVTRAGIAYVPQGRRLWASLTVHEHLKLAGSRQRGGKWSLDEIYGLFPRLAERRNHLGKNLSGGEQQMVAIARALLLDPVLVVMDEPTEGLAPVIVRQMIDLFLKLAEEGLAILLIEQNLSMVLEVATNVAVMENGRLRDAVPTRLLRGDVRLQRQLFGFQDDPTFKPEAAFLMA